MRFTHTNLCVLCASVVNCFLNLFWLYFTAEVVTDKAAMHAYC